MRRRHPSEPTTTTSDCAIQLVEFHQPTDRSVIIDLTPTHAGNIAFTAGSDANSQVAPAYRTPLYERFAEVFLPQGYPKSVAHGYARYQMWDLVQGLTSYLRAQLAMKEMLVGLGVGDVAATATASAMAKVVLDGSSMIGSLVFTWWKAADFGLHVRQWRLFADVINDVGLTLQMVAPLCGKTYFLPVACVASICSTLCGVAAGATSSSISHYFARGNNLADLVAKEQAQEHAVNVIGLVGGYVFLSLLHSERLLLVWGLFVVLTIIHVLANVYAMHEIRFCTINECRFNLLYDAFITREQQLRLHKERPAHNDVDDANMCVDAICAREPLLPPTWNNKRVFLGQQVTSIHVSFSGIKDFIRASHVRHKRYCCIPIGDATRSCTTKVHVMLHRECSPLDVLEARFEAERIRRGRSSEDGADFTAFRLDLEKYGWDLTTCAMTLGPWRYEWGDSITNDSKKL